MAWTITEFATFEASRRVVHMFLGDEVMLLSFFVIECKSCSESSESDDRRPKMVLVTGTCAVSVITALTTQTPKMYSPDEDFLDDDDFFYHKTTSTKPNPYSDRRSANRYNDSIRRESSEHLQRLHRRVTELEDIIHSQNIALSEKDAGHRLLRSQLQEFKDKKDRQVRELTSAVTRLESQDRDLDKILKKKSEE